MKKILIVENDLTVADILKQLVESLQFSVCVTHTLSESYEELERERPHIILLDRILPDGDGLDLAAYVHDAYFTMRVLCISTLGSPKERIRGLETGVDDYLPKPFSIKELELKLHRLANTEKVLPDSSINLGLVRFFPNNGMLLSPNRAVQLRKKEAEIFAFLCRHKNQVVSREQLIQYIWEGRPQQPTHSTLDVYIRRIRSKLGTQASLIKTNRSYGYSLTTA